jgi:hypothetical protein
MAQPPDPKQDEPPARRNWRAPVGRDAGLVGSAALARAGFSDPALVLHWPEIAGAEVARIARPLRFSPRDGLLTLMAEPAAALFLAHESRALAARINAYLGQETVRRIRFAQGRLSAPPRPPVLPRPAKAIKSSDPSNAYAGPDKLKQALQSLARWRAEGGAKDG